MHSVGDKIKELRTDKGETQAQLGQAIGVTAMAISKYESGEATPSDDNKVKLARHFGRSIQEIFFSSE